MMVRSPKFLLPVGAVLALGALILATPRTVQAVAAALVQITNTASNPVVTQTTGAQAANIVNLQCVAVMNSSQTPCYQLALSGDLGPGVYTVPSGNYLVITAIDVLPEAGAPCPGIYWTLIGNGRFQLATSNNPVTTHFTYPPPSGFVIGPGAVVYAFGEDLNATTGNFAGSCVNSAAELVDVYGYLTTT